MAKRKNAFDQVLATMVALHNTPEWTAHMERVHVEAAAIAQGLFDAVDAGAACLCGKGLRGETVVFRDQAGRPAHHLCAMSSFLPVHAQMFGYNRKGRAYPHQF
jgi:hypothetical protein